MDHILVSPGAANVSSMLEWENTLQKLHIWNTGHIRGEDDIL